MNVFSRESNSYDYSTENLHQSANSELMLGRKAYEMFCTDVNSNVEIF